MDEKTYREAIAIRRARAAIPPQTLAQVRATIDLCKKTKADVSMARAIVKHGNCTDEAREWARQYVEAAGGC